jgi:hypothetical protein
MIADKARCIQRCEREQILFTTRPGVQWPGDGAFKKTRIACAGESPVQVNQPVVKSNDQV